MASVRSDALVFFGATGDLAYKKIFPALQAMIKRGNLDIPVIGVANAGWNLDQLRARAKDSLQQRGGGRRTVCSSEAVLIPRLSTSCVGYCVMSTATTTIPQPSRAYAEN